MLTCSSNLLPVRYLFRGLYLPSDWLTTGLNYRLKEAGSNVTVVAFIIMPAATHSYTIEALKGQAVTKQLRDTVTEIQHRIGQRLFERTARYNG